MYEGKTRLWIPPCLVRTQKGGFRSGDVSSSESDAAKLRERPTELSSQIRTELFTGQLRFLLRFEPRSAKTENLRAMHAAAAVNASHRLPLPPALHRLGPLLGEVVLRDRLKRTDDFAIHDAGEERIELARHRRDARFIEQLQPACNIAFEDETAGLCDSTDGGSGRSMLFTSFDRSPSPVPGCFEVARQQPLVVP